MRDLIRFVIAVLVLLGVTLTPSAVNAAAEAEAPSIFVEKSKLETKGPVPDNIGLGAVMGEPSGFSAKFWTRTERAVDMGFAYSFRDAVVAFGDYLFHFNHGFRRAANFVNQIHPYAGAGAVIRYSFRNQGAIDNVVALLRDPDSGVSIGLRLPVGIEWLPQSPFGLFAELVPVLGFGPRGFGLLNGGAGMRYYF